MRQVKFPDSHKKIQIVKMTNFFLILILLSSFMSESIAQELANDLCIIKSPLKCAKFNTCNKEKNNFIWNH